MVRGLGTLHEVINSVPPMYPEKKKKEYTKFITLMNTPWFLLFTMLTNTTVHSSQHQECEYLGHFIVGSYVLLFTLDGQY